MNASKIPQKDRDAHGTFFFELRPYANESFAHLDYGTGEGWVPYVLARNRPWLTAIGYDPNFRESERNQGFVAQCRNLLFTTDKEEVLPLLERGSQFSEWSFDTASAMFVLHENGEERFKELLLFLEPRTIITVLDYDMKGISRRKFYRLFDADSERKAIHDLGFEEAFREHTKTGLTDHVAMAEKYGCETIKSARIGGKYFYWFGKSPRD